MLIGKQVWKVVNSPLSCKLQLSHHFSHFRTRSRIFLCILLFFPDRTSGLPGLFWLWRYLHFSPCDVASCVRAGKFKRCNPAFRCSPSAQSRNSSSETSSASSIKTAVAPSTSASSCSFSPCPCKVSQNYIWCYFIVRCLGSVGQI